MPSSGGGGGGHIGGSSGGFHGGSGHIGGSSGGFHGGMNHGGMNHGDMGPGMHPGGFHGPFMTPPPPHHNHHRHFGRRRGIGIGCLPVILFIIMLFVIFLLVPSVRYGGGTDGFWFDLEPGYSDSDDFDFGFVPIATKMNNSGVFTGTYLEDKTTGAYIKNAEKVIEALEFFREQTGIIPYLYVTQDLSYDISDSSYDKYVELFDDEGHLLIYFNFDGYDYEFEMTVGDDVWDYLGDDGVEFVRSSISDIEEGFERKSDFGKLIATALKNVAYGIYFDESEISEAEDLSENVTDEYVSASTQTSYEESANVPEVITTDESVSAGIPASYEEPENVTDVTTTDVVSGILASSKKINLRTALIIIAAFVAALILIIIIAEVRKKKEKRDFTDVDDYIRENGDKESSDIYNDFSDRFRSYDDDERFRKRSDRKDD